MQGYNRNNMNNCDQSVNKLLDIFEDLEWVFNVLVAIKLLADCIEDILPYGLVVRILAFHAGGPGSIPGVGRVFF